MHLERRSFTKKCVGCSVNVREALETDPEAYYTGEEMLAPLKMMYDSLHATNDDSIGNGRLLDVIRQVHSWMTEKTMFPVACDAEDLDSNHQHVHKLMDSSCSTPGAPACSDWPAFLVAGHSMLSARCASFSLNKSCYLVDAGHEQALRRVQINSFTSRICGPLGCKCPLHMLHAQTTSDVHSRSTAASSRVGHQGTPGLYSKGPGLRTRFFQDQAINSDASRSVVSSPGWLTAQIPLHTVTNL